MDITVCICTHNRPGYVRDCLDGLRAADRRVGLLRHPGGRQRVDRRRSGGTGADGRRDSPMRGCCGWSRPASALPAMPARGRRTAPISPTSTMMRSRRLTGSNGSGSDRRTAAAAGNDRRAHPAALGSAVAGLVAADSCAARCRSSNTRAQGEYRTPALPAGLEPYGANMVVHVLSLLAIGGFGHVAAAGSARHCCRMRRCSSPGACRRRAFGAL